MLHSETEALAPTRTASFVQLAETISELFSMAESAESDEERSVQLAEIDRMVSTELRQKADAIGWFEKHAESEIEKLKGIRADVQARIVAWEARQERLRDMIRYALERIGADKVQGSIYTLSLRKPVPSVEITDALAIPPQYIRIVPAKHEPQKAEIAKALRRGDAVPGAELRMGQPSVQIR